MDNRVMEKIAELLAGVDIGCTAGGDYRLCNPYCENPKQVAENLLTLIEQAGYVRLADDQTLPGNPYIPSTEYNCVSRATWDETAEKMFKSGWRKVI